jgi:hypothetical protein
LAITLAQLRARAESISDQPASAASGTVVSIAQFNEFVNDGIRALYNKIVLVHPDFRVTQQANFTLTSPATNTNALPADFRSARGVKTDPGTTYEDFLPMFAMRGGRVANRRSYRISGGFTHIEPNWACQGTYALLYTPIAPVLAAEGTALDVELEQFQNAIVLHAAWMALTKVEWSTKAVESQLALALSDAQKWAKTQRSADPPRIEDVRTRPRRTWA